MYRARMSDCIVIVFVLATTATLHAAPLWTRQLGTSSDDVGFGISTDSLGNVYVTGSTAGSLSAPNADGHFDAFLKKYDATGTLLWTQQLGTTVDDDSFDVSADSLGNVYITGNTNGSLGGPIVGGSDSFLAKYDAAGTLLWTKHIGTGENDDSYGVSADTLGNVYIAGQTRGSLGGPNAGFDDAYLAKYDGAGVLQWIRQFGTPEFDEGTDVSTDLFGNVYISGSTGGNLGGPTAGGAADAFLAKYNGTGTLQWIKQLGTTENDRGNGVAADSLGNAYITGLTKGSLGTTVGGDGDAFLAKYDATGTLLWTQQLGSATNDNGYGVSTDSLGNAYISGFTNGNLGGLNAGLGDAFLAKYDAAGILQWTQQLGTDRSESALDVSADSLGNVFITGNTTGSLSGPSAGGHDVFLAKFSSYLSVPVDPDANGDGRIDGVDYLIWAGNYGAEPLDDAPGAPLNGDYNFDGVVNGLDYLAWASHYGQGPNDSTIVPEPGACSLLIVGTCASLIMIRRRG